MFDRLGKTIGDLLSSYVGLRTGTLGSRVKALLGLDADADLDAGDVAFAQEERPSAVVSAVSLIIGLDDQMLFEERDYDKKLVDESATPFSELRLPVYDILKFLVYSQCEVCECAAPYYEQIIKRLCKNVIAAFSKYLPAVESMPRAMGLQLLFEFEFLADVFQRTLDAEQDSATAKCRRTIWMLINGSREEVDNEGEVLTGSEMAEKAKQLKVIRYKSGITLESFA